ncbi:MAG: Undecaprenyl-phosphate mannosyltransferase [Verrucomicrobia bacterium ADurb.Bin345]|nr:MAG: Undecaprenyl-phosphate mannosyltransferase [Verrucomicrobia bacterium ADurb.Bin345]
MITEDRTRHRVCVIIPAYREAARIGDVVREVRKSGLDVLVVDDGSPDNTSEVAREAGAVVVRQEPNRGKGVALNAGFQHARDNGYEAVVTMDADGQHAPSEVPKFIEAYVRTGIPVLVGNRMGTPGSMPLVRRWTNRFMSWLLSRVMGQYVPDTQCGFRLYRCDVIPFVSAQSERFAAESEILLHVAARGIRIGAVRITTIYADEKSKISPARDTVRFLGMLLKYRRESKKMSRWRSA